MVKLNNNILDENDEIFAIIEDEMIQYKKTIIQITQWIKEDKVKKIFPLQIHDSTTHEVVLRLPNRETAYVCLYKALVKMAQLECWLAKYDYIFE
jgi:hypothetical protein